MFDRHLQLCTFPIIIILATLFLNTYSLKLFFKFLDFPGFAIEVTLSVGTMKNLKTSWPLEAELQISEKELCGKRIQMKNQTGWQDLPNSITFSAIKYDVDEFEFKSDTIKIEFRSIPGENFGKIDDTNLVKDITVNFATFWQLDNANKPNSAVGAVLENIQPQSREAGIRVQSGCKDVKKCECDPLQPLQVFQCHFKLFTVPLQLPYARHYNPLLIRNRS